MKSTTQDVYRCRTNNRVALDVALGLRSRPYSVRVLRTPMVPLARGGSRWAISTSPIHVNDHKPARSQADRRQGIIVAPSSPRSAALPFPKPPPPARIDACCHAYYLSNSKLTVLGWSRPCAKRPRPCPSAIRHPPSASPFDRTLKAESGGREDRLISTTHTEYSVDDLPSTSYTPYSSHKYQVMGRAGGASEKQTSKAAPRPLPSRTVTATS